MQPREPRRSGDGYDERSGCDGRRVWRCCDDRAAIDRADRQTIAAVSLRATDREVFYRCAVAASLACSDSMRFIVASSSFCQVAIGASCVASSERNGRRQSGHAGGTSGLAVKVTFRPQDTQQSVIRSPGVNDQGRRTDAASGVKDIFIGRCRITRVEQLTTERNPSAGFVSR